jgi:hypothetical protein
MKRQTGLIFSTCNWPARFSTCKDACDSKDMFCQER